MSGNTDLRAIDRMIRAAEARTLRFIHEAKESIMSALDDATTALAAKVNALQTEVANANAKTDAALAALATSIANGTPVTQAELDAINAIGTTADAATASLQSEEAKVNAALNPTTPPPAPAASAPPASA